MLKKIIGMGILLILSVSVFCACESIPEGSFYTLQQANNYGWLSQEDMMSIAYYYNGGRIGNEDIMPENFQPCMNKESEESKAKGIKQSYWNSLYESFRQAHKNDEVYLECYGSNRKWVAVTIGLVEEETQEDIVETINGVTFLYRGRTIKIWKEDREDSQLDENGNGLADGIEYKIRKAYYNSEQNLSGTEKIPLNEISIVWCFGSFNGAYVVCRGGTTTAQIMRETVEGFSFVVTMPLSSYIYVYLKNKIYTLQDAADKGLLTHDDIAFVHKEYNDNLNEIWERN